MFLDRKTYDDLRLDAEKCRVEARVLSDECRFLRTTLDWMRIRLTQIERERAQMLFTYTGVKVESPAFEREPLPGPSRGNVSDILSAVQHFEDVGDKEAGSLGIAWHPDGTLNYGN